MNLESRIAETDSAIVPIAFPMISTLQLSAETSPRNYSAHSGALPEDMGGAYSVGRFWPSSVYNPECISRLIARCLRRLLIVRALTPRIRASTAIGIAS